MRTVSLLCLGLALMPLGGCSMLGLGRDQAPARTVTISCGSKRPVSGIAEVYLTMPEPRTAVLTYIDPRDGAHSRVEVRSGDTCLIAPTK